MKPQPGILLLEPDPKRWAWCEAQLMQYRLVRAASMEEAIAGMEGDAPCELVIINPALPALTLEPLRAGSILFMGADAQWSADLTSGLAIPWDWIHYPCEPELLHKRLYNLLVLKELSDIGQSTAENHAAFVRNLVHDLRTPMATIGVTLSSMERMLGKRPITELPPKLDKIRRAIERQQEILETALKGQPRGTE